MAKKRRPFTAEQKVAAIRRHLIEKVKVSTLCDELKIHPNQYYEWQKSFFENGEAAFKKDTNKELQKSEEQIKELESVIVHKDSVIAEIISDNIELKKDCNNSAPFFIIPPESETTLIHFLFNC